MLNYNKIDGDKQDIKVKSYVCREDLIRTIIVKYIKTQNENEGFIALNYNTRHQRWWINKNSLSL